VTFVPFQMFSREASVLRESWEEPENQHLTIENVNRSQENEETQETAAKENLHQDGTSSLGTLMQVLRTFIGTGILAMPMTFKHTGLVGGVVMVFVVWVFMTYSLYILVDSAKKIGRHYKLQEVGYGEAVELALKMGPSMWAEI
jgi:hypothetical protein